MQKYFSGKCMVLNTSVVVSNWLSLGSYKKSSDIY